jgi:hypothetical protein
MNTPLKVKIATAFIFPIYLCVVIALVLIVLTGWTIVRVLDFLGIIQAFIYLLDQTANRLKLNQLKRELNN